MNKLERLLDLLAALLETEMAVSRHDLRRRMPRTAYSENEEAFRRTFERDKDELRALGLPLIVEPVPGTDPPLEGYRIHRSDYGDGTPELDPDELAALHLASNLVRLGGMSADEPFFKLGGMTEVSEDGPLAEVPGGERVEALIQATAEGRVAVFNYGDVSRTVEPNRLVFNRGHWYLIGYDRSRDGLRQFRVDRICGGVKVLWDRFDPPETVPEVTDEPPWCYGDEAMTVVRLLVDAQHAPWIGDYLGDGAVVEQRDDGSVVVEQEVRNSPAFRSFALTFLDGAEILGPDMVRSDLCTWLEALA